MTKNVGFCPIFPQAERSFTFTGFRGHTVTQTGKIFLRGALLELKFEFLSGSAELIRYDNVQGTLCSSSKSGTIQ
jgi:hypothetical protein